MEPDEIKVLLENRLNVAEVDIQVEGNHISLVVISPDFEGLNAVKKQQLVYSALNDKIADGTIHAVNMKTFTPVEWQQRQA